MGRTLWKAFSALCVLTAGMAVSQVAHAAPPAAPAAESQFFTLLNAERAKLNLKPLARDPKLDVVARAWSTQMDSENSLHHRPDLAAQIAAVEPKWTRGGENVGFGGDISTLHQAFVNSPKHYENIVGEWNRVGVGAIVDGSTIWVTFNFLNGPAMATSAPTATAWASPGDVWVVTADGQVNALGSAPWYGDMHTIALNKPIVGMAPTPSGKGYWLVASDGGIFTFGDATFLGSTGSLRLNSAIVAIAPTPTGKGYWLAAGDGGIFAFGDATFLGSMAGSPLNAPVNGISSTPSGNGYWLVASDGGIFTFGDARFFGSTGAGAVGTTITGISTTATGNGYLIVGADGRVFGFGDGVTLGNADSAGSPLSRIATTHDNQGYRMVAADGRVFNFGSAGSGVSAPLGLRSPVVALAAPN